LGLDARLDFGAHSVTDTKKPGAVQAAGFFYACAHLIKAD